MYQEAVWKKFVIYWYNIHPFYMKKVFLISLCILIAVFIAVFYYTRNGQLLPRQSIPLEKTLQKTAQQEHPLSIEYMRRQNYPGSDIVIEQTLASGSNYSRFIASYISDGFKIYALLTIPIGEKPETGWPVIIFNHGYIPPEEYKTTEKYIAYTDAFSRNGYIVFRSDYRGHGESEGKPEGAYYSPAYTIDVLNAVASIKKYPGADSTRIGMWGHSMGGMITLRSMVINRDIKAGDIWAGVVASYEDLAKNWHHPDTIQRPFVPSQREQAARRPGRQSLIDTYGDFETNPIFWRSIEPISYVQDVSGPIQLQHGSADEEVPLLFSQRLESALKSAGKPVKFYIYEGDDHNLSSNLYVALERSVQFFDIYLK